MTENPQKENGFVALANEIVEALSRFNLSPYEWRVLMVVFRKTYGYNKKEDWIATSQIVSATGMHKAHVSRAKSKLIARRIVIQTGNKVSFNKFYSQWLQLPKQVTRKEYLTIVTQTGNAPPPIQVITPPPKQAYTKDNLTKDILQKTSSPSVKGPHPGVQAIMDVMKECFGDLDDSKAKNRQYAWLLLKKAKMNVEPCLVLARAASKHEWWGTKITKVADLYKNAHKIANALREKKPGYVFIS